MVTLTWHACKYKAHTHTHTHTHTQKERAGAVLVVVLVVGRLPLLSSVYSVCSGLRLKFLFLPKKTAALHTYQQVSDILLFRSVSVSAVSYITHRHQQVHRGQCGPRQLIGYADPNFTTSPPGCTLSTLRCRYALRGYVGTIIRRSQIKLKQNKNK